MVHRSASLDAFAPPDDGPYRAVSARPSGNVRRAMERWIDVVIPTRNREHLLPRVVAPLLEDPQVRRVIVVDDATQPTVDAAALGPGAVEVVATGGVGPAKAREAGAERAQAEVLLFLDDDVLPQPGLASGHAHHHERSERLLVCGYTPVVPRPGTRLSGEAEVYGRIYEDRCARYEADGNGVLTHLWGGNFSLRREDALRVGLASDRFRELYHEDRDFGLRCLEAGLSAVFDRELRAGHQYERGWRAVGRESYRRGYGVVLVHQLHGDVIGPFDEHQFERELPRPLAVFVRGAACGRWGPLATGGLHALRRLAGRLRLRQVELDAVRMLRRIEAARGALHALDALDGRARRADG
jgi:glycosyltransferase involved in cell wall biosynthesis